MKMSADAFKYYGGAEGAGMEGKYTTPFCNLLINRPVKGEDYKVEYDENGEPIGFGSINFRVRCMGEDNKHGANFPKYPIWRESERHAFNEKIINHFYYREIGCESIAQFCHKFASTMCEIMPKYNRMILAREEIFDKDNDGKYKMLFGRYDNFTESRKGNDNVEHRKSLTKSGEYFTDAGQSQVIYDEEGNKKVEWDASSGIDTFNRHGGLDNENPEKNVDIKIGTEGGAKGEFPSNYSLYATNTDFSNDFNNVTGGNRTLYNDLTDQEGGNTKTVYNSSVDHKGYKDANAIEFMKELPDAYLAVEQMIFNDLEPLFMGIF